MSLADHRPRSRLAVAPSPLDRPRFPVIDAHNHLGGASPLEYEPLIEGLDEARVHGLVDLDGGWGEEILGLHLDHFKERAPDRFRVLGGVDWGAWAEVGDRFGEWAAERLEAQLRRGADGIKIWKILGLSVRDHRGELVTVDDERLEPVWATAGALGMPVVIHVADPVAFFDPLDGFNERWEELIRHPEWHVPSPPNPTFDSITEAFARVVASNPSTTFIGAHVGCFAENLDWVDRLMERCPNLYVDIAARIAELGRQPHRARRFFMERADRILFGLDLQPDPEEYLISYRFLETWDDHFDYSTEEMPPQGRWRISGLGLPADALRQIYQDNAASVFGFEEQVS